MTADQQALLDLNLKINDAENNGDRGYLAGILAPKLAFQRANPARTIDDREAFLQKVDKSRFRVIDLNEDNIAEKTEVYGDRAIVKCIITVDGNKTHNIRLFVRRGNDWKLLGWANEPEP